MDIDNKHTKSVYQLELETYQKPLFAHIKPIEHTFSFFILKQILSNNLLMLPMILSKQTLISKKRGVMKILKSST